MKRIPLQKRSSTIQYPTNSGKEFIVGLHKYVANVLSMIRKGHKMKNKIFQAIWFVRRGLIPRKTGEGIPVKDYSKRLFKQLELARFFGGPKLVLIGDSNSEAFSNEKDMKRFHCVAVGLGIGGTRADQWVEWFESADGQRLKSLMGQATVVWNIGGNHVLQNRMDNAASSLKRLKQMFPDSWNIMIPPIHHSILKRAGVDPDRSRANVEEVNRIIEENWSPRVINLYKEFMGPNGEAFPGLLADPVHYGRQARKIIVSVIRKVVGC